MQESVDIVSFLEHNWFAITVVLGFGGFLIKMTMVLVNFKNENIVRDENLNKKIDEKIDALEKKMDENLSNINTKIHNIDDKISLEEERRFDSAERNRIIMSGVEATLITLHNQGHNGPVTQALEEMKNYKNKKSAL